MDDPMSTMKDRCNKMCNDLWKNTDQLKTFIDTLPEGDRKEGYNTLRSLMGMIAELYAFQAMSMSNIHGVREWVQPVWKKVFGDQEIVGEYNPEPKESLIELEKNVKEKENIVDWIKRDLEDKAKDTEKVND